MSEENEYRKPDYEESELFPSGNAPKPLFPQVEPPSVKPLFGSSAEQETPDHVSPVPEEPRSMEISSPVNDVSGEIPVSAPENPAACQTADHVPESRSPFSEPVVTEKAAEQEEEPRAEVRKVPAAVSLRSDNEPRYGQVRERLPMTPGGKKEKAKRSLSIDLDSASLGAILSEARNQSGLSIGKASETSRIKAAYIKALESDDFSALPKGIFPNAYVRSLCDLYLLDDEARETVLRKVAENLEKMDTVPQEILQQIDQNVQRDEQEEKRITKIFYATVFCAGLLLILAATGIVMAAVSFRKTGGGTRPPAVANLPQEDLKRTPPVEIFDTKKLESLTPPQIPCLMQELSVPRK